MNSKKSKEGVSVKEIEAFTKKHRLEVFFCLLFVLACFFSFIIFGAGWSIILATVGAIIGALAPVKIQNFSKGIYKFVFKQEKTTQMVLGIVALIIAIFVSPLVFLLMGLHAGKDMSMGASEMYSKSGSEH